MRSARLEERASEKLSFTACTRRMWLGKLSIRNGWLKPLARPGSQIIALKRWEPAGQNTKRARTLFFHFARGVFEPVPFVCRFREGHVTRNLVAPVYFIVWEMTHRYSAYF